MSKVNFEHLFEPLQVGPMTVPNRICETTNTINSSMTPGRLDEHFIAHHGAKARGGTGWIGSETWLLNLPFPPETPDEIGLGVGFGSHFATYQDPGFAGDMAKFCEEIHQYGSVAVVQLTHLNAVWAPSPVPIIGAQDYTPHVMGEEEIEFCLNTYADAAEVAKKAGADGIEIHCAHETLGYSFLSPVTNRREDKWGGGPQERVRFVLEALKRVRERVGDSMALGIRISGAEFRHQGYDNMELREMLYCIGEAGLLDFVDIDAGHCWGAPSYVPNSYYAHAQFREFGKAAMVDLAEMEPRPAVLFTGRCNDPVLAEELLRDGICDLVGMVRAGIADPEFGNKAREGRLGEIRRCISCTRCIDEASEPVTVPYTPTCSINPVIGNELLWQEKFQAAETAKRVVVVGGGLAGCEAARVAAMRGHHVTLLDQGKRLGGQLLIAAKAPGRDDFEDQCYFEENEMTRVGVDVRLETSADLDNIKALAPDAVVIATGSVPRMPEDIPGIDLPHVVQGWDVMQGKATTGDRVAIISQEDYYETPCVAEYLTERGKQVEVFHKSVHLGYEIARYSIGMVLKHMEQCGVTIHPNLILTSVTPDGFELASSWGDMTYQQQGFDSVVLVYGSVAKHKLYDELKADGSIGELYLAGSAWLPRHMAEATRHGASIGLAI
ncbi:FAD-dependent oxidoreductase [Seongchinamella sediminis]|uniref:FAD-dependent oxidoreductase n=1 Tax=Seongchinamella sediminis TaxID=2283635 RepID=A0A3L7DYY7_9GAMM|nr:FAD-dependent oxidoreductase [Seongchinamella sediminis]RLQ21072.1 FAD-dependent oxidoreductase [Seongchinamella sediminis]